MSKTGYWIVKSIGYLLIFVGILLLLTPLLNKFWAEISTALYWLGKHIAFRVEFLMAAGAFLLIGFSCLGLARSASRRGKTFSFHTPMGKVGISLLAIEDYLSKLALEVPSIESLKPRVSASKDGKKLRIDASVTVASDFNLKKSSEMVQRDIATAIRDTLGIEEVDSITISIDKILPTKKKANLPRGKPPFEDEEEEGYEGLT